MADESTAVAAEPTGVIEGQPAEDTGASGEQPAPIDWSARYKDDPALAEFVRKEADRLRQRDRDRERRAQRKQLAQEVSTAPDETSKAAKATELAQLVATEEDPEDTSSAAFVAKARSAEAAISRLRQTDEYAEIWNRHGQAEMNRRWHQDPEEYADWVWEQITDARSDKKARSKADVLSQAKAEDMTNQRLRNLATPMTGAGGVSVGGMSLDRLLNLPDVERRQWKQQHKAEYDQLVQALATS